MGDEIVVTNTCEVSWNCSCGTTNQCNIEAHPTIGDEKEFTLVGKGMDSFEIILEKSKTRRK